MPAVHCRNLVKDYGRGESRVRALRGVNLEIPLGELTMLVGPSGCGKTTLLSCIAGILEPDEGELEVLGSDLTRLSPRRKVAFRGRNIGFVFQQFNLLPALSAVENACVPLLILGRRRSAAVARAKELLVEMGMAERLHAPPGQLSGGQQQRVAIARALVHQPRLLVCDEPTSALDAKTGQAIMEILRRAAAESDRAVVVVTHDSRVFHFADRVAYMDDGQVVRVEEQTPVP